MRLRYRVTLGRRGCNAVTLQNDYWDYSVMQSLHRVTTGMREAGGKVEVIEATLQSDTGREDM